MTRPGAGHRAGCGHCSRCFAWHPCYFHVLVPGDPVDIMLFGRGTAWVAFIMTCGLMLFDYIDRQVIVSLFPDLKEEWGLSDKQLARSRRSAWTAISPRTSLLLVALTLVGAIAVATKLIWPFQLELDRERFFAVQAAIRNAPNPVIIFGDSIVQGATLPSTVCGVPLVNAGVRGAGIGYFLRH